jgi:iron complex transport system substrate-binding protein
MNRIICLTEETTEFLYLLGEEKRIVGITAYTERPEIAKKEKPIVSAFIKGNIKKIIDLKPDLIIGFSDIQAEFAKELILQGQTVLIFNQRSISEIFTALSTIGKIVSKENLANEWIDKWKNQIETWKKESSLIQNKKKIFFQEWDEPIITSIEWVSEAIEIAGGINVFANLQKEKSASKRIISAEEVADKNPDIIIGSWCGKPMDWDWVRNKKEWQNIHAIKTNSIYEMDPSIILQPGPALFLEGIPKLKEIISK